MTDLDVTDGRREDVDSVSDLKTVDSGWGYSSSRIGKIATSLWAVLRPLAMGVDEYIGVNPPR
jgi:hypothetical protein